MGGRTETAAAQQFSTAYLLVRPIDGLIEMVRKGKLQEVMSKALHADDPKLYTVAYRDFDALREVSLQEFLELSEDFQTIPASRIAYVKRLNEVVYTKANSGY